MSGAASYRGLAFEEIVRGLSTRGYLWYTYTRQGNMVLSRWLLSMAHRSALVVALFVSSIAWSACSPEPFESEPVLADPEGPTSYS